jgi:hypothetical protein
MNMLIFESMYTYMYVLRYRLRVNKCVCIHVVIASYRLSSLLCFFVARAQLTQAQINDLEDPAGVFDPYSDLMTFMFFKAFLNFTYLFRFLPSCLYGYTPKSDDSLFGSPEDCGCGTYHQCFCLTQDEAKAMNYKQKWIFGGSGIGLMILGCLMLVFKFTCGDEKYGMILLIFGPTLFLTVSLCLELDSAVSNQIDSTQTNAH